MCAPCGTVLMWTWVIGTSVVSNLQCRRELSVGGEYSFSIRRGKQTGEPIIGSCFLFYFRGIVKSWRTLEKKPARRTKLVLRTKLASNFKISPSVKCSPSAPIKSFGFVSVLYGILWKRAKRLLERVWQPIGWCKLISVWSQFHVVPVVILVDVLRSIASKLRMWVYVKTKTGYRLTLSSKRRSISHLQKRSLVAVPYIFSSVQKLKVTCVKRWGRINAKNLDLCSRAIRSGCKVYEVERFIRCQLNRRRRFPASVVLLGGWVKQKKLVSLLCWRILVCREKSGSCESNKLSNQPFPSGNLLDEVKFDRGVQQKFNNLEIIR